VVPFTYRTISQGLFDTIMSAAMANDPLCIPSLRAGL
jgi:hypothetical protein